MSQDQWCPVTLDDLIEVHDSRRVPLSGAQRASMQGAFRYYGASGVIDYIDKFIFDGRYLLIAEDGENLNSRKLPVAFIAEGKFWVNNHAHIVTAKDGKSSIEFLKHWFAGSSIAGYITGAAQPKLSQKNLKKIAFQCPDYDAQQKIAAILTAYDDLIENNRQRIALLEKMAEEIYREWFVRLRFPGHEHTPVHKGVPEGWELRRLDSFGKVVTGKTPPTSNPRNYGGTIPFVKTPDMHGNTFVYETEETLTEDGLNSQPAQILPANALCVSCIGTGGVVSITTSRCSTNQQINSICLKDELDLEWMFFTLRSLKSTILAYGATGATMTNLSKGKFSGLKPPVPPADLRRQFHDLVEPKFTQSKLLVQANRHLTQTRDLLLNRLISGKLRVDDLDIQFPPSMQAETA